MTSVSKHTPTTVRALAARLGCSVDITQGGREWQIIVDAPKGKTLTESGCHCSASAWGNGFAAHEVRGHWDKVAASVEEIIGYGLEDCTDPECDVCNPEA